MKVFSSLAGGSDPVNLTAKKSFAARPKTGPLASGPCHLSYRFVLSCRGAVRSGDCGAVVSLPRIGDR